MNKEQAKSLARWVVTACSSFVVGWAAKTGWADADTIMSILNSETFIGIVGAGITLVLSMFNHTAANTVAAVASMEDATLRASGIANIYTAPTQAGDKLSALTPGKVVAPITNPSPQTGVGRRA